MKKVLTAVTMVVALAFGATAQQADQRIGNLINSEDWFGLIEEYPQLKDSLQVPYLKLIAETMIYRETNRPAQAIECIDQLLTHHQEELGSGIFNFIMLRAQLLTEVGEYAQAADFLRNTLDQFKAQGATGLEPAEKYWQSLNSLRKYPALSVSRPNKDTRITFDLKEWKPKRIEPWMKKRRSEKDKALSITLPIKLHGNTVPFIFDTGAGKTFVSESFAKEHKLKMIGDTVRKAK